MRRVLAGDGPVQAVALAVIVVIGGLLRLHRFGDRSLWLDEGLTIYHSRRPWTEVLGFEGAYVENPPLYYALAKLAAVFVHEVDAGRLISVICGTATLAVVYLLVRELLDGRVALIATALLAISPLHIWYSQEGRQYAAAGLAVSVAYLALFLIVRTRQRRWVGVYAASLWLAMYIDYSALYSLAFHVPIIAVVWLRNRDGAVLAAAGVAAAALLYLPWAPQVLGTIAGVPREMRAYLDVTPEVFQASVLSVTGLNGLGSYFYAPGPIATSWLLSPAIRVALFVCAIAATVIGSYVLLRRSLVSLMAVLGLLFGTVLVAVVITVLVSPGYADRTILAAAIGWVILCAAAAADVWELRPTRERPGRRAVAAAGALSAVMLAAASAFTASQIIAAADKQHFRELAADVAQVAALGYPIILYPAAAMTTPVDVYQPGAVVGQPIAVDGERPIDAAILAAAGKEGGVWYAYIPFTVYADRQSELEALGYIKALQAWYWNPLYLELYVLPGQVDVAALRARLSLRADKVSP